MFWTIVGGIVLGGIILYAIPLVFGFIVLAFESSKLAGIITILVLLGLGFGGYLIFS